MEPKLKFAMTERMTGVEAVSKLSCRVAMVNEKAWSRNEKDTWPPDQSHQFTPLLLVHHKDQQREDQAAIVAQIVCKGDVNPLTIEELVHADHGGNDDSASNVSKLTKELTEILAPLEESDDTQFILIEGAPGIGKSVLLREIAYRWSKKQLLQKFTLVLLVCLRDQFVQEVAYISDLLLPFCKGEEKAKEIATNSSEFLSDTGGKHLLFLLDGFDEFPENLRNDSLIADILNRNVLPRCGLIISSRPHVSVELRNQATIKVDILGFTPKEQRHYIEKSLEGKRDTIEKLTHYLQDNLTISNLCLVPFNMVILLFLHKIKNHLPSNATELYDLFICLTICRHLAKNKLPFNTIKCLSDLPQPCKKVVQQVSKLALEALNENKLVFTDREIKAACPDVTTTPEAINAFGLLQAVQHFGLTGETTTFNFLHLSIQEYLAAHYFKTDFQHEEELRFLHKYFWSDRHANMFAIYIMLTKGQKSSFKKFLSDGNDGIAISNKFLSDQLKCFHLYFYFKEAKDDRMCKSIEEAKIFSKQKIHLASTKLSATDLEHMSVFLTTSMQKQWWELNLHSCNIQDCELHIINNYLNHSDTSIKIERLYLNNNYLTRLSSSYISNIVVRCKVQVLSLSGNKKIGQSGEIYSMLTNPSSVLAVLYMSYTTLSSVAVGKLFAAVKDTNVLKSLTIEHCGITDDAAKDITTALSINKSLARLRMDGNEISGEVILKIIQALSNNDVLQHLHVPGYSRKIGDKIRSMEQNINDGRKSQGVQTQLIVYLL